MKKVLIGLVVLASVLGAVAFFRGAGEPGGIGATVLRPWQGGTGFSAFTDGDVLVASGSTEFKLVAASAFGSLVSSTSGNFEIAGYASASKYFSGGLATCSTSTKVLRWATTGLFSCGTLADADIPDVLTLTGITGPTSVSGTFEVIGLASSSTQFGSGLVDCDTGYDAIAGTFQVLQWTASGSSQGKFSCRVIDIIP